MAASSSLALVPSSSFSSLGSFEYIVFLSFRGEDTRKGFTGHLYKALKDAGIHTFMDDDEMKAGEKIGERLLKAIEGSRYCVVILSKGYADSKWCLIELAAMVEHKKVIIPVFYYVEPSDVRSQRGSFEMAFSTHQERFNSPSVIEEWKQAMTKVGQLKGFVINDQSRKYETQLIQEIVERVGGRSTENVMLHVADHPVGINSRVEEVMKLLSIEEGGIKMVGIYGMGGVGKTTLAKEIHNTLLCRFDKATYIEGIKDEVKKAGLPKLQQQFISNAFKHGNLDIYNSSEGIAEIRMRFRHTRLLAVLDDVDHRDQLKALVGGCDWFGEGTRILITTRDMHLLHEHQVDRQYEVRELDTRDSLRLFSWHAFHNENPSEEYMEISKQVAEAAGGLPLALEVLGSFLSGRSNKRIWQEVLIKLRAYSYHDIDRCLRISFDGLDQEEQSIFLDIACFFIDWAKDCVIDILRVCDFKVPELTIDVLLQKCLLKVDKFGSLHMHDLLRNMGRNIGSRSRLWDQQQVWDVLDGHTGTPEIEGIVCRKIPEREEESLDVEAFTNMSNLRLLHLDNIHLKGDFSKLPTRLRSLQWSHCSMKVLPDNFNIKNVKILNLQCCGMLKCLPEAMGSLTTLEQLILDHCGSLKALPNSIGDLRKLRKLSLSCVPIAELPNSIQFLKSLTHLDISFCNKLKTVLPLWELKSLKCLMVGSTIELDGQMVGNLVEMSGKSPHTQECRTIDFLCTTEVAAMWFLSVTMGDQKRVIFLFEWTFHGINGRQWLSLVFPEDFVDRQYKNEDWSPNMGGTLSTGTTYLHRIRAIDLSNSDMEELDESIVHLPNLKQLYLSFCKKLKCLPSSFGCLTSLMILSLLGCESLTALPDSIGGLTNLYSLVLGDSGIREFPNTMKYLCDLRCLNIRGCVELRGGLPLYDLQGLRTLVVGARYDKEGEEINEEVQDDMVEICGYSEQLQQFRRIRFVGYCDTPNSVEDEWELSITTRDHRERVIKVLAYIDMVGLQNWQWLRLIFPEDFDRKQRVASWPSLSKQLGQRLDPNTDVLSVTPVLKLCEIDIQSLPDTVGCLRSLRALCLHECKQLTCLPESIGYLTRLGELDLQGCTSLLTLPNSIGSLTRLETLALASCTSLTLLPNSIGNLKGLVSLDLTYSGIEVLPDSFSLLESLACLAILGCRRLQGNLPLWKMKCLMLLIVGGEVDEKDEGDGENGDQKEDCEIPDCITHYSQQAEEYRRIHRSNIQVDLIYVKWELSIWVEGCQEREIELNVFRPCEGRKGQSWLRHIFPKGFTPQYDTRTRSEASVSHSSPSDASVATEAIVAEGKTMISLESEPLVSLNTWYDFLN